LSKNHRARLIRHRHRAAQRIGALILDRNISALVGATQVAMRLANVNSAANHYRTRGVTTENQPDTLAA
jgi:hypothetical protein